MSWLGQTKDETLFTGLTLNDRGVAAAVVRAESDGRIRLKNVCWLESKHLAESLTLVPDLLKQCDALDSSLTIVLAPEHYSLLQLDKPDMDEAELREALRWRIKDMVDFPVFDALIDMFDLPISQRPGVPSMCYVVASPKAQIDAVEQAADKGRANLRAIDIPELALRDLVMHTGVANQPNAYLSLQPKMALIEVCVDDRIYLSRQIPLQFDLNDLNTPGFQTKMDSLLLEVQRSLDYFESQYGTDGADTLYLLSSSIELEQAFLTSATLYMALPVEAFKLEMIEDYDRFDEQTLRHALLAIGAAIREMPCED